MIDALTIDSKANNEEQQFLATFTERLRKLLEEEKGGINEYITLPKPYERQTMTLLGIMIDLEGEAGLEIPSGLLPALRHQGMKLEQPVCDNGLSPLPYAMRCNAVQIATWLLENGADASQMTDLNVSNFFYYADISEADQAKWWNRLVCNGFDCSAIYLCTINCLLTSEEIISDDKLNLVYSLAKHKFDCNSIREKIVEMLAKDDISLANKVKALKNLENFVDALCCSYIYAILSDETEVTHKVKKLTELQHEGLNFFNKIDGDTMLHDVVWIDNQELLVQLLQEFVTALYESHFKVNCKNRTPWTLAAYQSKIDCAVLLIGAMAPDDVRTRALVDAQGNPAKDANDNLGEAIEFLRERWLNEDTKSKIKQAFLDIGIQEDELL